MIVRYFISKFEDIGIGPKMNDISHLIYIFMQFSLPLNLIFLYFMGC
jgi:hypothetical protein